MAIFNAQGVLEAPPKAASPLNDRRVEQVVLNDNAEPDYLAFVRDPANGFRSMTLPLKGGTELSVKAP